MVGERRGCYAGNRGVKRRVKLAQLGPKRSCAARAHSIEMGHVWATADLLGISRYS